MADHDVFLEKALIEDGVITAAQREQARSYAAQHEVSLFEALVLCEATTAREIALVRADVCEAAYVDLASYDACFSNTRYVPRSVAERYQAFPLFMADGVLTLAMADPLNIDAADQVRQMARCDVDPVLAEPEQIRALIARAYSLSHAEEHVEIIIDDEDAGNDSEPAQPVVAAVNQILHDAADERASDIHINPDEHELHLRYRIDGVLQSRQCPPKSMHASLVQRLKVMANLDLTQTRRPQDGKFRFRHNGLDIDVRMSTLPTVCGENVVLRLLANAQSFHDFHELGIPAGVANQLDELFKEPYGMILVTGPTGSGKTTTLYTGLARLNEPSRNIMTIEDPVEIRLPYVRQIQVHHDIGLTFASALRSILRQDPDVVLVGEVRDTETATIAMQAALTGHLVLSTLHTNDAVGAVSRLLDYGLPPFVINSGVLGIQAQRLVRRVCQHCVGPHAVEELQAARFSLSGNDLTGFVAGKGCGRCSQTGYKGRVGIYELFELTSPMKKLIETGASVEQLREAAVREGMELMWHDGLTKARLGQTTLDEVAKVASIIDIDPTEAEAKVAA